MQRIFSVLVACAVCVLLTTRRCEASFACQACDVFRTIGEGFEDAAGDFKTGVLGSQVEVSIGERYMRMPKDVDAGKVTFKVTNMGSEDRRIQIYGGSIWRTLTAILAPGQTAKFCAYLQSGYYDVIASAQSGPTKVLRTELTARPE